MLTKKIKLTAIMLSVTFTATSMADDVNSTVEKALKFGQDDAKYGQIKFDLRYRYENFDSVNPKLQPGNASTARLRLGYLTPVFQGLQGFAEFEGNQDIGSNSYNTGLNGKTQYERIADPQRNELNQLWVSYKGIPKTEAKVGRQRIQLDNERFIGAAAWRQLERTYDALMINNTSLPNTAITMGYINRDQNTDATIQNIEVPVANISYNIANVGKLVSYGYLIDYKKDPNLTLRQQSNQTYGASFDGTRKLNDMLGFVYRSEYAYQTNYGYSTPYNADYYHVVGGLSAYGFTVKGAMEQLGGKGTNKTFDTPLGLLHRFSGWADVFTTTPDAGYRDVYASVEKEIVGVKFTSFYRDWSDDTSKKHFGREIDFMLSKDFFKHYNVYAKYANFSADTNGTNIVGTTGKLYDTQKVWVGGSINY